MTERERESGRVAPRILVPLDGSRLAERVLPCATAISNTLLGELVLFRAVSIPADARKALDRAGIQPETLLDKLEAEADHYLRSVARRLVPDSQTEIGHMVRRGQPAEAIVEVSRQADVGLIIMASRGHQSVTHRSDSSVAERVMQVAGVPVLMVYSGRACAASEQSAACKRILLPLDGSKMAEKALKPAAALAQALGSELVLFEASVPFLFESSTRAAKRMAQRYLKGVADRLKEQGVRASIAVQAGPAAQTITQYARRNHIDLIAMYTHGRKGIARMALGSVADRVLRAGNTPVMMVRAA